MTIPFELESAYRCNVDVFLFFQASEKFSPSTQLTIKAKMFLDSEIKSY